MELLQKHPLTAKYASLFNKFNVNTQLRLSHFVGQMSAESNLKPIEENLRYSEGRLLDVFPKYFTPITAKQYAMQPSKIANRVYANRMGNGDENSGDGYRYRGRGFLMITGKNNYRALTEWANKNGIDADYLNNPDLLLREADSIISALWFWTVNNINQYADKDDILSVSRIINVGNAKSNVTPHGMQNRIIATNKFKKVFAC